ncbi:DUF488 domain-containing protein [Variovorax sp. 22077]|uniref:DUF488 domain-containing protein n=1 Tax=Variovorax sp. 22077 TaxID=3453867 RepID=UPI003F867BF1
MVKNPSHLYTLGYEGFNIDTFIARIREIGVQLVLDVRELPLSRKKGFSKSSFRERLASADVAYLHAPTLGCPKPIRDRYRKDADWAEYTRAFLAYISGQEKTTRELVKLSKTATTCLVCFEADYEMCHRTYVARAALKQGGLPVMHLTARTVLADSPHRAAA